MSDVAERVDSLATDQFSFDRRLTSLKQHFPDNEASASTGSVPFTEVTQRFERIERSSRDFEIVTSGLPNDSNGVLLQSIKFVAGAINVSFSPSHVAFALRLRHIKSKFKPPVIRFTSTFIRDEWIAKKMVKKDMPANEIVQS